MPIVQGQQSALQALNLIAGCKAGKDIPGLLHASLKRGQLRLGTHQLFTSVSGKAMQHFRTEREIESGIELEQQQDF